MTDTVIRRLTAAAVLLVAAIAAVISFVHIEHLAATHGQAPLAAYLLPLSIDGTVVAASMVMLRAARAGDGEQIVRGCYIDTVAADAIARRARQLREQSGTLSGYALGEQETTPAVSLLADVLAVMGAEERMWSETIAARLAELRLEFYKGWDAAAVGDALRVRGVEPGQQWGQTPEGEGANRRGVTREQIAAAIAASGGPARSSGGASGQDAA